MLIDQGLRSMCGTSGPEGCRWSTGPSLTAGMSMVTVNKFLQLCFTLQQNAGFLKKTALERLGIKPQVG